MERAELESLVAKVEAEEAELRFPALSNDEAVALGARRHALRPRILPHRT
jgi:hypothetical protein